MHCFNFDNDIKMSIPGQTSKIALARPTILIIYMQKNGIYFKNRRIPDQARCNWKSLLLKKRSRMSKS